MTSIQSFHQLLARDPRYKLEAYQFIRESLTFAHDVLRLHELSDPSGEEARHITGQQLCEACRVYAQQQYGYLARLVLNRWGIFSTGDFGEIVYNLIDIEQMRKSESDRREDFEEVFEFETAFQPEFVVALPNEA